ncbi:hypothetical protein [Nonomuraea sp. NPDC046570]|uniref:hypothetical protein n=1 Tax=Nonomuraea sp. NPDC046570 TaxID=3155255 RepID=UPI0033C9B94F
MAEGLERAIDKDLHADLERHYLELAERWPQRKVEIVDGRIVVRATPSFSEPGVNGYARFAEVCLGEPLMLPEPWGLVLDTGPLRV